MGNEYGFSTLRDEAMTKLENGTFNTSLLIVSTSGKVRQVLTTVISLVYA